MPETKEKRYFEVWATIYNKRTRVYRGPNEDHVAWKVNHYKDSSPEVVEIPYPGSAGQLGEKKN